MEVDDCQHCCGAEVEMEAIAVNFNKLTHHVKFPSLATVTVGHLKARLAEITGVPINNQKLMFKGIQLFYFIN